MSRIRRSLTFSNVVALMALFFAIGGSAYAVTGAKIKAGSVGATQIQAGSITGTQVKSGSLGATQINQTTLTGISAANIHAVQYVVSTVAMSPEAQKPTSATATRPSGMKVIGGGAATSNWEFGSAFESTPTGERNGWTAQGFAFEQSANRIVTAICTAVATTSG